MTFAKKAVARLGRHEEAAAVAAPLGSDYLLAQVAPRAGRPRRAGPHGRRPPRELRGRFLARGRLAAALAGRWQEAVRDPALGSAVGGAHD